MYEETVSGYKTKLTINDVVNNKVITEREAQDFGNPAVSFYNNKLYLAYSSYFDSNSSAKIESYDLEKNEWKVEKTSTINKSNVHYIKQYGNKLYVLIGADKTSPIVYTYDGTTWSEDKINLINNYSNLTMNIINDNVYLSYINTQDNKTNLLKLSNHKSEIIDSNLGSDCSYLYTENDKENMYAITSDNNSTSINIKTKKIETDNSNNSTDDKGNDNNKDNNKENEGTDQSKNGFVVEDGNTYYYVNGKKLTGRNKIDGIEYYFDSEGSMVKGIYEINGEKYLFGVESGKLYCNGLAQTPDGKIYITDNKGRIQYGWQTIKNDKYYFNSEGSMVKGIYEIKGEKYLFGVESGKLYCNGLAQTPDGKIYLTDNKGRIQYGWQTINNEKYYFNSDGSMVK